MPALETLGGLTKSLAAQSDVRPFTPSQWDPHDSPPLEESSSPSAKKKRAQKTTRQSPAQNAPTPPEEEKVPRPEGHDGDAGAESGILNVARALQPTGGGSAGDTLVPTATFSWLHLSDLYTGKGRNRWDTARRDFFDDLRKLHKRSGPWQVVMITGDLTNAGEESEFASLQSDYLAELWNVLQDLGSGDAVLLTVPGNHDVVRPLADYLAGEGTGIEELFAPESFAGIADAFWTNANFPARVALQKVFEPYDTWNRSHERSPQNLVHGLLPGDFSCTLETGTRRIGIVGLNNTFLYLNDGVHKGRLTWDVRQVEAVCGGDIDAWVNTHDLCLLLTHHGPQMLTKDALQHGEEKIFSNKRFTAWLYGHSREGTDNYMRRSSDGVVRLCQRTSLQGSREMGYAVGSVEFFSGPEAQLNCWPRIFEDSKKTFQQGERTPFKDGHIEVGALHLRIPVQPPAAPAEVTGPRPTLLAQLDSDSVDPSKSKDLLKIEDDVRAFARLVASSSVTPPLSIGLFGDWGSGKSFFMDSLLCEVQAIAQETDEAMARSVRPDAPAFFTRIVQVKFNAWQYAEANLWASITDHIFRNLRITKGEEDEKLEKRRDELIKQIDEARAQQQKSEKTLETLREEEATKQNHLKQQVANKVTKAGELDALKARDVWAWLSKDQFSEEEWKVLREAAAQSGLTGLGESLADGGQGLRALRALRGASGEVGALWGRILVKNGKSGWQRAAILLLSLGVALAVWLLGRVGDDAWKQVTAVLAPVFAAITGVFSWIEAQAKRMNTAYDSVAKAYEIIDSKIAKAEEKKAEAVEKAAKEVADVGVEVTKAETEWKKATLEVEVREQELEALRPGALLKSFIQGRVTSDDYQKHLGVLTLVRRDFTRLNDLMMTGRPIDRDLRIDRIVLYIDDLDRCPESRVVQVLEAVHLLLALPLFVVVVGVDARWVEKSLERRRHLKSKGDSQENPAQARPSYATPRDYVEKIFQIPFWLKPLRNDNYADMIEGLIPVERRTTHDGDNPDPNGNGTAEGAGSAAGNNGTTVAPTGDEHKAANNEPKEPPANRENQPHNGANGDGPAPVEASGGKLIHATSDGDPASAREEETKPHHEAAPNVSATDRNARAGGERQRMDLNPQSLEIPEHERAFMTQLAPLVRRSPRTVKRFVNTYRLLRARFSTNATVGDFANEARGDFRAAMFLLAMVVGSPRCLGEVLVEIAKAKKEDDHFMLTDYFPAPAKGQASNPGREEFDECLRLLKPEGKPAPHIPIRVLKDWLPFAKRYSFENLMAEDVVEPGVPFVNTAGTTGVALHAGVRTQRREIRPRGTGDRTSA